MKNVYLLIHQHQFGQTIGFVCTELSSTSTQALADLAKFDFDPNKEENITVIPVLEELILDVSLKDCLRSLLIGYAATQGTYIQSAIRDALTDLRHICDESLPFLSYGDIDSRAYEVYMEELNYKVELQQEIIERNAQEKEG